MPPTAPPIILAGDPSNVVIDGRGANLQTEVLYGGKFRREHLGDAVVRRRVERVDDGRGEAAGKLDGGRVEGMVVDQVVAAAGNRGIGGLERPPDDLRKPGLLGRRRRAPERPVRHGLADPGRRGHVLGQCSSLGRHRRIVDGARLGRHQEDEIGLVGVEGAHQVAMGLLRRRAGIVESAAAEMLGDVAPDQGGHDDEDADAGEERDPPPNHQRRQVPEHVRSPLN